MKVFPYLVTGPVLLPLADRLYKRQRRYKNAQTADAIDNLHRLYRLKEVGAITDEEFRQYKDKLSQQL